MTVIHPNKAFFNNHPLKQMSPAAMEDFQIRIQEADEFHDKVDEILQKSDISPERWALVDKQKADILKLEDAEAIVSFMRKPLDNLADRVLCRKALGMADEV